MHVYHYAAYETSALKRLAAEHGTREDELDELLRREVFVDLYTVARQALRISYPSYSIKKVREFYMDASAELEGGDDAIVALRAWLDERDPALLERIERYNEEDCLSTSCLRDWLLERRAEAEAQFGVEIPWRGAARGEGAATRRPPSSRRARASCATRSLATGDPALALMGDLLEYHRREASPVWWWFFARCEMTPERARRGLRVDRRARAGRLGAGDGREVARPRLPLPGAAAQARRRRRGLRSGDDGQRGHDRRARRGRGDAAAAARAVSSRTSPLPTALIPGGAWTTSDQQAALMRSARSLLAGDGRYPHLEKLLRREPPLGGARVQCEGLEEMGRLVREVEGSYLFVQGPPGSGKTWTGARLITHLIARGKRVGDRLAEPQGDPQAARRDRGRRARRRASPSAA